MPRKESATLSKPSVRQKTRQEATTLGKTANTSTTSTSSTLVPQSSSLPTSASRNAATNLRYGEEGLSKKPTIKLRNAAASGTHLRGPRNVSRMPEAKPSTVSASTPLDEDALAERLDKSLRLSSPIASSGKERRKGAVVDDQRQLASQALVDLKLSLQKLADAVQLGWKVSSPTKGISRKLLDSALSVARDCIGRLRVSSIARSMDVEKSASQIVGRVISLELVSQTVRSPFYCQLKLYFSLQSHWRCSQNHDRMSLNLSNR